MVGGDEETFAACKPYLGAMGKNMVLVGGPGAGGEWSSCTFGMSCVIECLPAGVTKICNNLSLAISMVGTAEAMNLVSSLTSTVNSTPSLPPSPTSECRIYSGPSSRHGPQGSCGRP